MKRAQRVFSLAICFVVLLSSAVVPVAHAGLDDAVDYGFDTLSNWLSGDNSKPLGGWTPVGYLDALFFSNKSQKYYTTPTSSVVDKSGNVTNYYRGGDTTDMKIIDSYNKTFNTIHNTTNNTNNYQANVKLSDFLNQYTTNNVTNKYTYSADFKSWYYDNTTNNYNYNQFTKNDYTQNNLYYNQDNSRYYISIDNSTDEYYLVDVQYSPTFVTVNYTYNTTNNNYEKVGDVTNVYYYELKDGRNSSTLTVNEISGLDINYDVANYDLVTDDPNTLSLQHFDGDYTDSSSFNRSFYSENRSTNYVDSGAFGKAVSLPNGAAAGVTIPGLSGYDSLSFDFRIYYSDISKLGVYFGDTNVFQEVVTSRSWKGTDYYTDHSKPLTSYVDGRTSDSMQSNVSVTTNSYYSFEYLSSIFRAHVSGAVFYISDEISTVSGKFLPIPTSYLSSGFEGESDYVKKYGWMGYSSSIPSLFSSNLVAEGLVTSCTPNNIPADYYLVRGTKKHYADKEYHWSPSQYVLADFSYDSYKNQWVSMRITIANGNLYYFVNGDLVGSGPFTKPTADKFYIKSSGTIYLDELRVTTGSLSSTGAYTPSSSPFDTNKVLALPDELTDNTIYVQHNTNVTNCRIGGVRPSNPIIGFLYIPLHDDRTAAQPQLYDGSNWIDVTAMVHNGDTTVNVLGYKFSPVGDSPDIDIDAKPERPTKPGENVDPETCTHEWKETKRTAATCTLPGSVESTCSKCKKTKTESLPKLGHTWEVKQSVQTTYDEDGNVLTQGFTIYRCSVCGEEYKDTDGTGPPAAPSTPSTPDDPEEEGWLSKLGKLLGSVLSGLIDLLDSILGGILDGLINLVTSAFERLKQLVDLFGSFGEALGVLWTWLPPEVMMVLITGVTVFVLISLLKLFLK